MKMVSRGRFFNNYLMSVEVLSCFFLFCVLSYGRAFAIIHIQTPLLPLFVTEIFLLISIPVLFIKKKSLSTLPKYFLCLITFFFLLGYLYFYNGVASGTILAARDIVLFVYILFLPICVMQLDSIMKFKVLITLVIASNIVNIYSGLCMLLRLYPFENFRLFLMDTKITNFGLYYGIASAFMISFYHHIKQKHFRLLCLIMISLDFCMFIMICKKALWVAVFVLCLSLFLLRKKYFIKLVASLAVSFIVTFSAFMYLDYKLMKSRISDSVTNEVAGYCSYISEPAPNISELMETPSKVLKKAASKTLMEMPSKANNNMIEGPSKKAPVNAHFTNADSSYGNMVWRMGIWKQTFEFAMVSPFLGRGYGVYPEYKIWGGIKKPYEKFTDSRVTPPHNHILTIFLKMGLLGLSLFLAINIYAFIYGISYLSKCRTTFIRDMLTALLSIFLFWHSFAFLFDVIDSPPTSIFLWIIMGMIFAAVKVDKKGIGSGA